MQLYKLWIIRCQIIYTLVSDGTNIEEKIDLRNEIRNILANNKIHIDFDLKRASTAQLKRWLFNFYSRNSNIEAYNNINKRTIEYRNKINRRISE